MNAPRQSDTPPRVRFAPSPTGSLHVGGARTALFNWLFARGRGGKFILRIEDTDRKRSRKDLSDEIVNELGWLGLDWDEGPFYQADRFHRYQKYAEQLLARGAAYREEKASGEGSAIIFRVNHADIRFQDLVYGDITIDGKELKDIVLIKSDGSPAYNFACAVDDHEMNITHVIRGEDHIANTPKQILIYNALGWDKPVFAHLPLILGEDKAPLSKRHGATSLRAFREGGFLPAALRNYLALLGWSPGDDREFLSTDELIEEFSLRRVSKRAAVFDYQKLTWLNGKYIRGLPPQELAAEIEIFLRENKETELSRKEIAAIAALLGPRIKVLPDFIDQAGFILSAEIEYEPAAVEKHLQTEGAVSLLRDVRSAVENLDNFTAESIETALRGIIRDKGIKAGELIHPLRVAVTGKTQSPGIFETLILLGKDRVLNRLDKAIAYITSS